MSATPVVRVADQHKRESAWQRFNAAVALKITSWVGSMNCAWAFAALACISLPAAISSGSPVIIVSWISQTLLQLTLLSVILVGQNLQAAASDARSEQTYRDVELILAQFAELHKRHDELQSRLAKEGSWEAS